MPSPGLASPTTASDADDDISYSVRDFVQEQNSLIGQKRYPSRNRNYKINIETLYYVVVINTVLILAEFILQDTLNKSEINLIVSIQAGKSYDGWLRKTFDLFEFEPMVWGLFPGILLLLLPDNAFRLAGYRILILNSLGRFLKWNLNLIIQQGRPFWISSKVKMWHCPQVYGFPSGHALLLLLSGWCFCEAFWSRSRVGVSDLTDKADTYGAVPTPTKTMSNVLQEASSHTRTSKRLEARAVTFVIVILYLLCMISRVVLGTHFLHSLFFGFSAGILLLQIVSERNLVVWLDKITTRSSTTGHFGSRRREFASFCAGIFVRVIMHAFTLLVISETVFFLVNKFSDGDPRVWNKRSQKFCKQELDTRGALPSVYGSVGALTGALAGIELLAWEDGVFLFPSTALIRLKKRWILLLTILHMVTTYLLLFIVPEIVRLNIDYDIFRLGAMVSFFCHFVGIIWAEFAFIRISEWLAHRLERTRS